MAKSSLERTGEKPPVTRKGHDTAALGPSDRSDTGSDIAGAPGLQDVDAENLARGTTSDPDRNRRRKTAGPDIGDENLDSDTDSGGTGERSAAGRDASPPTDQDLRVIGVADEQSDLVPAEDLEAELVEEDREFGDEAASDDGAISRNDVARRGRPKRKTTRARR
jgi:hypothetical protein